MTPLEAAARAICDQEGDDPGDWMDYLPEARAAIKAIREPSAAMLKAAVLAPEPSPNTPANRYLAAWTAMLDVLLEEWPTP